MKKWSAVVSFILLAVLLSVPIGLSPASAADSGGYGSSGTTSTSSGYGSVDACGDDYNRARDQVVQRLWLVDTGGDIERIWFECAGYQDYH